MGTKFGREEENVVLGLDVENQQLRLDVGDSLMLHWRTNRAAGGEYQAQSADSAILRVQSVEGPHPTDHRIRMVMLEGLREGRTRVDAVDPASGKDGAPQYLPIGTLHVEVRRQMVFYPGERREGSIQGGMLRAGGRQFTAATRMPGQSTRVPIPAGEYVLAQPQPLTQAACALSALPKNAALRLAPTGEVEYWESHNRWLPATGPRGALTLGFAHMMRGSIDPFALQSQVKQLLIDPSTGQLREKAWSIPHIECVSWNLLLNGRTTRYFIRSTPYSQPDDIRLVALRILSDGCIFIDPATRLRLTAAQYLRGGQTFFVCSESKRWGEQSESSKAVLLEMRGNQAKFLEAQKSSPST